MGEEALRSQVTFLEKPQGGGSNLHPPSCFRVKSRKVKENIASNKTGETETNSTPQQMAFEH